MKPIQLISAPSILGLFPGGVENLSKSFLSHGLADKLTSDQPVIHVPILNHLYHTERDIRTNCLNTESIVRFSSSLIEHVTRTITKQQFALVLGGDCSILLGIMPALKKLGTYGLIFLDAHADFYEPEKSTTGQVADMDLAIVSGRGPEPLTNMDELKPYVADRHIVHIGQRDWQETKKYRSQDIKETPIKCFDLAEIETKGIKDVSAEMLRYISNLAYDGFWIHFDTDVLSDQVNPAVDYRLPGGLQIEQAVYLITELIKTNKSVGMSVTIFNPTLDTDGRIAKSIVDSLEKMLI